MLPPGHVAVTWATAQLWPEKNLDYRWLALAAMVPDIIDKPLALWVFTESQSTQNIAHALIPNLCLLVIALLWLPRSLPYILACNGHILADHMWNHTETFWWPLFGWSTFWQFRFMNSPEAMLTVYLEIIQRYPHVWVVELIAVGFLGWLSLKYTLYKKDHLIYFLRTGRFKLLCA